MCICKNVINIEIRNGYFIRHCMEIIRLIILSTE